MNIELTDADKVEPNMCAVIINNNGMTIPIPFFSLCGLEECRDDIFAQLDARKPYTFTVGTKQIRFIPDSNGMMLVRVITIEEWRKEERDIAYARGQMQQQVVRGRH